MSKLCITLPPFSPDYSGVCSALFELNGIEVIHDASGCTGNYTGYDEPRWYGSSAKIYCSGLREMDAVLGRDDILIDKVVKACEDLKPDLTAVLGSPVPMVIGTDMEGIACEIEERTDIPSFGFATTGLTYYNKGIEEAMMALIRRFCEDTKLRIEHSVNILGMTPLDFSANSNFKDIPDFLEKEGFRVQGHLMMGVSLEQIRKLGTAAVNLVVAESGLKAAEYLKDRFGTPYVAGIPVGNPDDRREGDKSGVIKALEAALKTGENQVITDNSEEGGILIVAEQVAANSIRRAVLQTCPACRVTVGTMFGLNPELAGGGDLDIKSEKALKELIHSGRFKKLAGDPLFGQLIREEDRIEICPLPHVAISSKIHWDECLPYVSGKMGEFIENLTKMCEWTGGLVL